ncbi:MAG: formyltetrahydrofolate deformylase [Actinomycetes bacterium]|jgi:formyltetrahydrofolate deformylase
MDLIATLQCTDQPGIVHAMTSAILACGGNIIENQQFTDPDSNVFVMRTRFETQISFAEADTLLRTELERFTPNLSLREYSVKKRAIIMVTTESHCLRELLFLREIGEMPVEIVGVFSNHNQLRELVESAGLTFTHLPLVALGKEMAERDVLKFVAENEVQFVILARYMQILSHNFCQQLAGKIINIHHSFLPGFKGSKPYHQAHARGVKIIGATAHFVTADLDEGPIIDQDVAHVTHQLSPEELIALGRDIERRVLSRAVKLFAEDRIFIVGQKTIVFN